tara:strand:+ start:1640 stop:2281 length:642 start_codon:yes stop_codon:yes gene_type:complete
MKRLVTFGCSLTYGSKLENPNDAWPNQLATKWNLGLNNMACPGTSTKRIWWEIINFDFKKTDTVVVLWTHMDRWCILKDTPKRGIDATGHHEEWDIPNKIVMYPGYLHSKDEMMLKKQEAYYKYIHDNFDMLTQYLCYINHAHNYLKNKVSKQYHARASEIDKTLDFNRVDFLPIDFDEIRTKHPKATDNQHPGKEAYAEFVNKVDKLVGSTL